jgi:predicted aspartyl protease
VSNLKQEWKRFNNKKEVVSLSFTFTAVVNKYNTAKVLIDTGCDLYCMVDQQFAEETGMQRIKITPKRIRAFDGKEGTISEVAKMDLWADGFEQTLWGYILPTLDGNDLILGTAWMKDQHAVPIPHESKLVFKGTDIEITSDEGRAQRVNIAAVSYRALQMMSRRNKKRDKTGKATQDSPPKVGKSPQTRPIKDPHRIMRVSLEDIDKALQGKTYPDPRRVLPPEYQEFADVFNAKSANSLPPHREGVDHSIDLVPGPDGKGPDPPFGPLYPMTKDELIVLKKLLTDLADKKFIRPSSSPAAAPVLLVKKPGGGVRFCVDYRALNAMTKKDRYPLPLIHETLERVGKAKWFSKFDVVGAFHRVRVKEGDEWKTAFRTRFGLWEWLVTPFGLTNAPGTFQRYINSVLAPYLDDFASAYVDDVLVYTDGSLEEHRSHVRKVLEKLREAGLYLDVTKSEFEVKRTKYLGFVIEAEKGVSMDPAKVEAVVNWARPTTVRGVRGFLGFANFYRQFIRNYSDIAAPLTNLTGKNVPFHWSDAADAAFQRIKRMFISAPILLQFDPKRQTVVEADSSGWASGGVLMQYDDNDVLRPCAFLSKKNTPAECNYQIHDKELLAIIRCLQE